jgi:hypothetical protein
MHLPCYNQNPRSEKTSTSRCRGIEQSSKLLRRDTQFSFAFSEDRELLGVTGVRFEGIMILNIHSTNVVGLKCLSTGRTVGHDFIDLVFEIGSKGAKMTVCCLDSRIRNTEKKQ